MTSRQHREVTTRVDVVTRDGGLDNRIALKLQQDWENEDAETQAAVATED